MARIRFHCCLYETISYSTLPRIQALREKQHKQTNKNNQKKPRMVAYMLRIQKFTNPYSDFKLWGNKKWCSLRFILDFLSIFFRSQFTITWLLQHFTNNRSDQCLFLSTSNYISYEALHFYQGVKE